MLKFIFAGKDSYSDYGIFIRKRPPLPSPKRRVTFIEVPGRDSSLRFDEGTYEDITIAVECTVKGEQIPQQLDSIKAWLFSAGESNLAFSFQPDRRYRAQVVNAIDFKQAFKLASQFVILFHCRPFKYAVNNMQINITTGSGTSVLNQGNIHSRPVIKVFCAGDGSFKINNREVLLQGISVPYIILDSELEEAYYTEAGAMVNANNHIYGEFPILDAGNNIITYTGGVTKLEITPNWRWL